jgi:hypothetical protein
MALSVGVPRHFLIAIRFVPRIRAAPPDHLVAPGRAEVKRIGRSASADLVG